MTTAEPAAGQRWHDLDAVRAFALLLGVALHGTMSFIAPRIWIIDDNSHAAGFSLVFYVIHMFRMITFFLLAGFFARMLMEKRGLGGFITNRLTRIGVPLVVFWPLVFAAIVTMLIIANAPPPSQAAAPAAPPPALSVATFPLTHLWFLYALLLLYTGAVVVRVVTSVLHIRGLLGKLSDTVMGGLVRSDLLAAVLALPMIAAFWFNNSWMMWFGVMTPDTGLVPNTMAVATYVTAFAGGWALNRRADLLDHFAKQSWLYVLSAIAGTWWCLAIAGATPQMVPVAGHAHPIYAIVYPLTAWTWVFGLIGMARRYLHAENCAIRYMADASYWVYIVHLPILLVIQYAVKDLPIPAEAKFAPVLLGTLAIALLSYQVLVRYSFIGTILNGRRRKVKTTEQPREATA